MKNWKLFAGAVLISAVACQKPEGEQQQQPSANPTDMKELVVNRQFDYATSNETRAEFEVQSQLGEPVSGIRIEVFDKHPDLGGKMLCAGQTQADGQFRSYLGLPGYLKQVYVRANLLGAVNEAYVSVSANQIKHVFGGPVQSMGKRQANKTMNFPRIHHTGKFYYMGTFNALGVPDYLEPVDDTITAQMMTDISMALPERKALDLSLVDIAYDNNIQIDALTDLWVTFVHEAAGYKNTLGFYKYDKSNPPATVNDIDSIFIIFPNTSYAGSGGGLNAGNKVYLGRYPAGTTIGWVLLANAWKGGATEVKTSSTTFYSDEDFNTHVTNPALRQHHVPLEDVIREHILLGFEDIARDRSRSDKDFNDVLYYLKAQVVASTDSVEIPTTDDAMAADTDGDGVPNYADDYPGIDWKAFNNHSYGTLAYEDLWPAEGDYDFNDLVSDYTINVITNATNDAVEIEFEFLIKAVGAGYENSFALQFDNLTPADIASVSGGSITGSLVSLDANNTEAGQSKAVIVLADKMSDIMRPSGGAFVNTVPGNPYVTPDTIRATVTLASPVDPAVLGAAPFNPFLIVNQDRGREVHLPDYAPSDLAAAARFGTANDDSDPATNRYYKTPQNLPWALHLSGPVSFRYPVEYVEIVDAYLDFASWAQSGGETNSDWYVDGQGQTNEANIY